MFGFILTFYKQHWHVGGEILNMAVRQTGVKIPAKWQQSLICSSVFQQPEAMESELWFKSEWLEKKYIFYLKITLSLQQ